MIQTNAWRVMLKFLLVFILGTTACATPEKGTAIGTGAGAITGGAIGGLTGGWKGAAIGATAGAALGAGIGNYLDKQAQELKQVANTKRTQDGILVNLKNDLLFETGSSVLKEDAIQKLTKLGDILAKYQEDRIRIEGYTDSVGSKSYNEALSIKRADAVKKVLVGRGVRENQITVLGQGESNPIASNKTMKGRAANRRVELHIDVPKRA